MISYFTSQVINNCFVAVSFSKSGRLLFAGYEDFTARGWDVLSPPSPDSNQGPVMQLTGHENRVTTVGVNPEGNALLTGSWDTMLRV